MWGDKNKYKLRCAVRQFLQPYKSRLARLARRHAEAMPRATKPRICRPYTPALRLQGGRSSDVRLGKYG